MISTTTSHAQPLDVSAFLPSLLYYLTPEDAETTEDDARETLEQWRAEGIETPAGLTPATLASFYRENAPRS